MMPDEWMKRAAEEIAPTGILKKSKVAEIIERHYRAEMARAATPTHEATALELVRGIILDDAESDEEGNFVLSLNCEEWARLAHLLNGGVARAATKADPQHLSAWAKRIADGIVFPGMPPLEHSKAVTFLESELESFLEAAQIGAATKAETCPTCKEKDEIIRRLEEAMNPQDASEALQSMGHSPAPAPQKEKP